MLNNPRIYGIISLRARLRQDAFLLEPLSMGDEYFFWSLLDTSRFIVSLRNLLYHPPYHLLTVGDILFDLPVTIIPAADIIDIVHFFELSGYGLRADIC